jgi:hypothetical protein
MTVIALAGGLATAHYVSCADSAQFASKIDDAYATHDFEALRKFFVNWANISRDTLHKRERSTIGILAAVNDIYMAVCKARISETDRYFAVQRTVDVVVVDTLQADAMPLVEASLPISKWNKWRERFTINNFGPHDLCEFRNVLLLDEEHEIELLRFLSTDANARIDNRRRIGNTNPESKNRVEFLRKQLPIVVGNWGKGWQWESSPVVLHVVFNKELTEAYVWTKEDHGGSVIAVRQNAAKWVVDTTPLSHWAE